METIEFQKYQRKIFIVNGNVSQTINICFKGTEKGYYEYKYRNIKDKLSKEAFVSLFNKYTNIKELTEFLKKEYNQEIPKESLIKKTNLINNEKDDKLINDLKPIIEKALINYLNKEFLKNLYIHRVEHSFHFKIASILENILKQHSECYHEKGYYLIQKEWPETIPRPNKDNRRGNFDLVILSPNTIFKNNMFPNHFLKGYIEPIFVFEIGLDYKLNHFAGDLEKVLNSKPKQSYLIHIERNFNGNNYLNDFKNFLNKNSDSLKNESIKSLILLMNKNKTYFKGFNDDNFKQL